MKKKSRLCGVKWLSSVHTAEGRGLSVGSCLTLRNELSKETHMLTKKETLLRKLPWVESRKVKEPRKAVLLRDSQSRVSRWWDSFLGCLRSLVLTLGPSWCCTHCSAMMDATEDSVRSLGHAASPFDLSWILPVGGGLSVLCSLLGPLVKLTGMVTMVPGQRGQFQSVCFP